MKDNKPYTELIDKMQQEQQRFRDWLVKQPPDEILGHAYEYCTREDILAEAEEIELRPAQMKALLDSPAILGDIFKDFCKCETDVMEQVKQCIEDRADKNLEKMQYKEYPAVYTQSAAYARQHDELPQYRESNRVNEQCRDEIDAAISFYYTGSHLENGAIQQVLTAYGPERTRFVLAAAIHCRVGDARISAANRKWADSVRPHRDITADGFDKAVYYANPAAHSGLLDICASQMRNLERAKESPAPER